MPVIAKTSFVGRVFESARRVFRNPFVRVGAASLGLGILVGACADKGRVMEAPNDGKGGWDLVAETYARNNLNLGSSPRISEISAALKGCFALTNNVEIAPKDTIVGEADGQKIHAPKQECVDAVMALATGGAIPVPAAATANVAPVISSECGPFILSPLDKIKVGIETLLRKKANDITINVPEGVTFSPESLAGVYVPQGMVDMLLSELTLSADGLTITAKATPTKDFPYSQPSATVPLTRTFELTGRRERKIGETESTVLITEELVPVFIDIEITGVEAAPRRGGGGHAATTTPAVTGTVMGDPDEI